MCTLISDNQNSTYLIVRGLWSLLNHFRAGQDRCLVNLHKCGLATLDLCVCGQQQTMNHMVNLCPLTKFGGGCNPCTKLVMMLSTGWFVYTAAIALVK